MNDSGADAMTSHYGEPIERVAATLFEGAMDAPWDFLSYRVDVLDEEETCEHVLRPSHQGQEGWLSVPAPALLQVMQWRKSLAQANAPLWSAFSLTIHRDGRFDSAFEYPRDDDGAEAEVAEAPPTQKQNAGSFWKRWRL